MQTRGGIDWNHDGEMVVNGNVETGSDIKRFVRACFTNLPSIVSKVNRLPGWAQFKTAGDLAKLQLDSAASTTPRPSTNRHSTSPVVHVGVHDSEVALPSYSRTPTRSRIPMEPNALQYPESTQRGN